MTVNLSRRYLWLWCAFWVLFFSSTVLSRAIWDPDFFWHLKTGEWIWTHHSLPIPDPFSASATASPDSYQRFILSGYWLAQLVYYGIYNILGWWGIVFLRFALAASLTVLLLKRAKGDPVIHSLLLPLVLSLLLSGYSLERPQFFSFLGFAALLLLLERVIDNISDVKHCFSLGAYLAILMAAWGNLHGGVVAGQVTLIFFACSEALQVSLGRKPGDWRLLCRFVVVCGVGLFFSLLNPNGLRFFSAFAVIVRTPENYRFVGDYKSIFTEISTGNYYRLPGLVLVAGIVNYLLQQRGRINVTTFLLAGGLTVVGFAQIRYFPFFLIAALPLASQAFSFSVARRSGLWLIGAVLAVQLVVLGRLHLYNLSMLSSSGLVKDTEFTPVAAADHILEKGLRGNLFNVYDWGGYLLFRLSPERKIFIDPRFLYEQRVEEWLLASGLKKVDGYTKEQAFADLVKKYDIRYVVIPKYTQGKIYWLADALNRDSNWKISFFNRYSVVFVKSE